MRIFEYDQFFGFVIVRNNFACERAFLNLVT